MGWETGRGTVQQNQRSTIDNIDDYYRLVSILSCSTSLGQVEANDMGFRSGIGLGLVSGGGGGRWVNKPGNVPSSFA